MTLCLCFLHTSLTPPGRVVLTACLAPPHAAAASARPCRPTAAAVVSADQFAARACLHIPTHELQLMQQGLMLQYVCSEQSSNGYCGCKRCVFDSQNTKCNPRADHAGHWAILVGAFCSGIASALDCFCCEPLWKHSCVLSQQAAQTVCCVLQMAATLSNAHTAADMNASVLAETKLVALRPLVERILLPQWSTLAVATSLHVQRL